MGCFRAAKKSVKKTSSAPKNWQPHHPVKMGKVDAPIEMQRSGIMAIESKMTIEDYMKKASGRYKVVRQDLKPQKETQATSSDFNGILSTFKKPSRQVEPKTTKGLSVADYRIASGRILL